MSRTVERAILKLRPNFRLSSGYFYMTPVGHILCGFTFEQSRSGAYISHFALPLYDRVEFIHLAFGDRLTHPQGYMPTTDLAAPQIAEEFIRRIAPFEADLAARQDPGEFLGYVQAKPRTNPWVQRGYVMTLIFLGRRDEALKELKRLREMDGLPGSPEFSETLQRISERLEEGILPAQQLLAEWEAATRKRLKIM